MEVELTHDAFRARYDDPQWHRAIKNKSEPVSSQRVLVVRRTFDPTPLAHFTGLRSLTFNGVGFGDLANVTGPVDTLTIWSSATRDLSALRASPTLDTLDIRSSLVQDISPLLSCEKLWLLNLTGCPLSEESFYEVRPRLLALTKERDNNPLPTEYDLEDDWKLMLELQAMGLCVVTYRYEGILRVRVPHLKYAANPELARCDLGAGQIRDVAHSLEEPDTAAFLDACYEKYSAEGYRGDVREYSEQEFIDNGYKL